MTSFTLWSTDPEPVLGAVVETRENGAWQRRSEDRRGWYRLGEDDDPETWTRVAGNYGPVRLVSSPPTQHTVPLLLELDLRANAGYIRIAEGHMVDRTVELELGVNLDLDEDGLIVGIEFLSLDRLPYV